MILKEEVAVDLATPTGPMRTYIFAPRPRASIPPSFSFPRSSKPPVPFVALPPLSPAMATSSRA